MLEVSARIRAVAQEAREHAGLTLMDIAIETGSSTQPSTILRFEQRRRGWSPMTDDIVGAYERACGLMSGELWRRAVGCDG